MIAIEGIDAAGKRTQSSLLEALLKKKKWKPIVMSFPDYETPIGRQLKSFLSGKSHFSPRVRHMLFAANRWEKADQIREAMTKNSVLIVNRYTESNIVYGVANGLPLEWLVELENGLPRPDLVIVLDASPNRVRSRRSRKDSYEKDLRLQTKVQKIYKDLAPRFGWIIVDASKDVRTVHLSVTATLSRHLSGLGDLR